MKTLTSAQVWEMQEIGFLVRNKYYSIHKKSLFPLPG